MRKQLSLIWFFLKSFHLHPLTNPLYFAIIGVVYFYYFANILDVHHVLLCMYAVSLTHLFSGLLIRQDRGQRPVAVGPVNPFIHLLPVSRRALRSCFAVSAVIYGLILLGPLAWLLHEKSALPELLDPRPTETVTAEGDTIRSVQGYIRVYEYPYRGAPRAFTLTMYPSILLDNLKGPWWWPVPVLMFFLLINLHDACCYCRRFITGNKRRSITANVTYAAVFLLGALLLADLILPHVKVRHLAGLVSRYPVLIGGLLVGLTALLLGSCLNLVREDT